MADVFEWTDDLVNGVRSGDTSSIEVVYNQYAKLIYYFASKFHKEFAYYQYGFDDILSIGHIAFMKSIKTYDKDTNIKFATYFSKVYYNEFLMYHRKNKKFSNESSYNEPLAVDDNTGSEITMLDVLGDYTTEDRLISKATINDVYIVMDKVLSKLPDSHRDLITMYIQGATQYQLSEHSGYSQSYCSRIITAFRLKLLRSLTKEGLYTRDELVNQYSKLSLLRCPSVITPLENEGDDTDMARNKLTDEQVEFIRNAVNDLSYSPASLAERFHVPIGTINYHYYKFKKEMEAVDPTKKSINASSQSIVTDVSDRVATTLIEKTLPDTSLISAQTTDKSITSHPKTTGEFKMNGTIDDVDELVVQISSILHQFKHNTNLMFEFNLVWGE